MPSNYRERRTDRIVPLPVVVLPSSEYEGPNVGALIWTAPIGRGRC